MIVGKVIKYNGKKYVITDLINNENFWSCGFDRIYKVIELEKVNLMLNEIVDKSLEQEIVVKNVTSLPFETIENEEFILEKKYVFTIKKKDK